MFTLAIEKTVNQEKEILLLYPNEEYIVAGIEGLSPPPASISGTPLTGTDGQILNNIRLDTRSITITLYINPPVETNRIFLYNFFKLKERLRLHYTNRTRDVVALGYVETFEFDLFSMRESAQITIKCLDPYLRSPTERNVYLSYTDKLFEYPFSHSDSGKVISEYNTSNDELVINNGEIVTGCVLELTAKGDVTAPITIYDAKKHTYIKLNTGMQNKDRILISTIIGNKTIELLRNGKYTNIISYLDRGSTWLQLQPGENVLAFTAGAYADMVEIKVRYTDKYLGV